MGQGLTRRGLPINAIAGPMPEIENEKTTDWNYLYRVPLLPGSQYKFRGWNIGSFTITGGSSGSFTIEGVGRRCYFTPVPTVKIYNKETGTVFHDGLFGDQVTVQDNPPEEGGSSVILTSSAGNGIRLRLIPIKARPYERIRLTGNRDFIVTGSGAKLKFDGTGSVTVNGDLLSLKHAGEGTVVVHGNVHGNVSVKDVGISEHGFEYVFKVGKVTIDGYVGGQVVQYGGGLIEIKGNLMWTVKVKQTGYGEIVTDNETVRWAKGKRYVNQVENQDDKVQVGAGDA